MEKRLKVRNKYLMGILSFFGVCVSALALYGEPSLLLRTLFLATAFLFFDRIRITAHQNTFDASPVLGVLGMLTLGGPAVFIARLASGMTNPGILPIERSIGYLIGGLLAARLTSLGTFLAWLSVAIVFIAMEHYLRPDQHRYVRWSQLIIGFFFAFLFFTFGRTALYLSVVPAALGVVLVGKIFDLEASYLAAIEALTKAMDAKDTYTAGHARRVAQYAVILAEDIGLKPVAVERTRRAALLHDIGKIGIDDRTLGKTGMLTPDEMYKIKRHPDIGADILGSAPFLRDIGRIVRYHHERHDGNGYPESLVGGEIPIESAIIAVADAFDAMTSNRAYRKALTRERAIAIILGESGDQFHPMVVDAFHRRFVNDRVDLTIVPEER